MAAAGLALALFAQAGGAPQPLPEPGQQTWVRVSALAEDAASERLQLPGVVRSARRAELGFLLSGQLAERRVTRGQQVAAGDVLAVLHVPSLSPILEVAEARLRELDEEWAQLGRELQRQQDLHRRGLAATDALERLQSRRAALDASRGQARARRDDALEQLAEARLRAPWAGRVAELRAEPGEQLAAGQPVLALVGEQDLEIELRLGSERASRLEVGQPVAVLAAHRPGRHAAEIAEIGVAAPGRAVSVLVRLRDKQPALHPGDAVRVEIEWQGSPQLWVPLDALIDTGTGSARLFRLDQDRAEQWEVQLGALGAGRVAVVGLRSAGAQPCRVEDVGPCARPLQAGDQVVIAGHGQLLDGAQVRVLP